MKQVQAARAECGRMAVAQLPRLVVQLAGRHGRRHEKTAGDVRLHVLPERVALRHRDALALDGAVECVAEFERDQRRERQRLALFSQRRVRRFGRGFLKIERGDEARVGKGYHS